MRIGDVVRTVAMGAVVCVFAQSCAAQAGKAGEGAGPVKVFVQAGQSNMVGDGRLDPVDKKGTLLYMATKSDSKDRFKRFIDADGGWVQRDDVWFFQRQPVKKGGGKAAQVMTLDVACGLKPGLQGTGDKLKIGPELGFGHVMGEHFDDRVLIVKTAWGGKSLAVDFRPPSAGAPEFEIKAAKDGTKREVGKFYRQMLADVKFALDNIEQSFPEYAGQGYEIVGFGWHQGWNDGTNKIYANEYGKNLPLLIQDVRRDLGVADLPVVIASSGFGGHDEKLPGVRAVIRDVVEPAQIATAKGMDGVTCVETRGFHRPPEESPTGASYHWNSNAETYVLIGDAMGEAMKALLAR